VRLPFVSGRCGHCLREWAPLGQAHCASCHEQFNSTAAFDRHRRGFECIPAELFGEPQKNGLPLLVKARRADGEVWVTALRESS
jgi:hypothetical protein